MDVALKKQSEIHQIIVSAIASERSNVLQLASDFQFDGIALHLLFIPLSARRALSFTFCLFVHYIQATTST